jgi:hypothetical protein
MLKPKQLKQLLAVFLSVEYVGAMDHGKAVWRCPICCQDEGKSHGLDCSLNDAIQLLRKELHIK